ncbi:hypothetical protein BY996DRAFT_6474202 [Phakopsora pachyrhizi]|nr:hypothetical protein BY996DRAFT_6474202 [Phakopsora pachyrhizi]
MRMRQRKTSPELPDNNNNNNVSKKNSSTSKKKLKAKKSRLIQVSIDTALNKLKPTM